MSPTVQFAVVAGVMLLGLIGWGVGGYIGAAVGLVLGLLVAVVPWRGQPAVVVGGPLAAAESADRVDRTHHGGERSRPAAVCAIRTGSPSWLSRFSASPTPRRS